MCKLFKGLCIVSLNSATQEKWFSNCRVFQNIPIKLLPGSPVKPCRSFIKQIIIANLLVLFNKPIYISIKIRYTKGFDHFNLIAYPITERCSFIPMKLNHIQPKIYNLFPEFCLRRIYNCTDVWLQHSTRLSPFTAQFI